VRFSFFSLLLAPALLGQPTFYRDVLPILQKKCQACHRPGEVAPFPLLSYEQARPWAKAMKAAVLSREMPPWFADGGHFLNDRSLSEREIQTINAWASGGASAGNPTQGPAPIVFVEGWRIHKPDAVFDIGTDFTIPESGEVPYQNFLVHTSFKEDRWIRELELRPGNRGAVHHLSLYVRPPGSAYFSRAVQGRSFVPAFLANHPAAPPTKRGATLNGLDDKSVEIMGSFLPGSDAIQLPPGQAFLLKTGSDLIFEIHYTTSGKKQIDRSSVGFVFAERPAVRLINAAMGSDLHIPPKAAEHHEESSVTFANPVELRAIQPHMHLRGVGFEVQATYPSGKQETLLKLRRYDFNWQLVYELNPPAQFPRDTVLTMRATYDNSANNRANPNPDVDVYWGDQTTSEMFLAGLRLAIPIGQKPSELVPKESLLINEDVLEAGSWQEMIRRSMQGIKQRLGR